MSRYREEQAVLDMLGARARRIRPKEIKRGKRTAKGKHEREQRHRVREGCQRLGRVPKVFPVSYTYLPSACHIFLLIQNLKKY